MVICDRCRNEIEKYDGYMDIKIVKKGTGRAELCKACLEKVYRFVFMMTDEIIKDANKQISKILNGSLQEAIDSAIPREG